MKRIFSPLPRSLLFLLITLMGCNNDNQHFRDTSTLRISTEEDPQTLDPRKTRDLGTVTSIHMLYEGLMGLDENGKVIPAIAKNIQISEDQKTYLFELKETYWSNGDPLTASDFIETWRSVLSPQSPYPNAYQLYLIKGAKEAKEGRISVNEIAMEAMGPLTLKVELVEPTPYFLNLLSNHFFYPVHASIRSKENSQGEISTKEWISNGPFKLEKWRQHDEFSALRNPYYWDKDKVKLHRISLIVLDNSTALKLFEQGELDWAGSPISTIPVDALATLKNTNQLHTTPAAGVYFFRYNTAKSPLNNLKVRKALTLALNRQELVDHVLQGNQVPSMHWVPSTFFSHGRNYFVDSDTKQAQLLLKDALEENSELKEFLQKIKICYGAKEISQKIAQVAQRNFKDVLGIDATLDTCESKVYFDRLKSHDYDIGIGSWFADFHDPISFLEVFKARDNGTNNTEWENPDYIKLLTLSGETTNPNEREQLLLQAEEILMNDMPIAPLFTSSYNYMKTPALHGVYFSDLGFLDFKHAYKE